MNSFPKEFSQTPQEAQLAKETWQALGLKDPLSKVFLSVCFLAAKVFDYKQQNYGPGNIAKFGDVGVMIRMSDKSERLINLWKTGADSEGETREDTFGDAGVYGFIALMCRWNLWPGFKKALDRREAIVAIDSVSWIRPQLEKIQARIERGPAHEELTAATVLLSEVMSKLPAEVA